MREQSRVCVALVTLLAISLLTIQWIGAHHANINWDEFALFGRAKVSTETGRLVAGGRPGLAALALMPFASACTDSVASIVDARVLWLAFTLAYLAAIIVWLRVAVGPKYGWQAGAVAAGLLTLVPVFLRWSLQVRTDQPAMMAAAWGAVALAASRRRSVLALAAGALFGVGYLCSQKALYVVPAAFVIAAGPWLEDRSARQWRHALIAVATMAVAFGAVVVGYQKIVAVFYALPPPLSITRQIGTFAYYRTLFGFRAYYAMLPTLGGHVILVGILAAAILRMRGVTATQRIRLIQSGAILLIGVAIGLFHAAAFPYFWMTLGLFPALAIALSWERILAITRQPLGRALLLTGLLVPFVYAVPAALDLARDTQAPQRDAMSFLERNFPADARGFQAESALTCRRDPAPFQNYFAQAVADRFSGPDMDARIDAFINEFRTRPVSFLIANRLFRFPDRIEEFWRSHYVMYRSEVMVAGQAISGRQSDVVSLDVIAPGLYRWTASSGTASLQVDGRDVSPGTTVELATGTHSIRLAGDVTTGLFTLALKDPPQPDGAPFYDPSIVRDLDPPYRGS